MALNKQSIALPFAGGQNDKIDPFQLSPSELLSLNNAVFKKEGKINKRNGYSNLDNTVLEDSSSIITGYALSLFKSQLQLFDGTKMFSYLDNTNKWTSRGSIYSIDVDSDSIVKNDFVQENLNSASNLGITAYAWDDSRGGVRYTVVDENKNATIISDVEVSATGSNPQVFATARFIVIFYSESNNIKYKKIDVSTPSLISTDVAVVSDLDTGTFMYDVHPLRDRLFIAWHSTDGSGSVGIRYMNSFLTISSDTLYAATAVNKMISILTDPVESKVWLYYTDGAILYCGILDYDLNELVAPNDVYPDGAIVTRSAANFKRMCGKIENDAAEIFVEYELAGIDDPEIIRMEVDNTATRTALEVKFFFNVRLYSKMYEFQNEFFFVVHYESDIQPTYFVYNTNKQVVTKLVSGNAGSKLSDYIMCRNVQEISNGKFKLPVQKKGRLESNENSYVFTTLGVQSIDLDHTSDKVFLSAEAANNLHVAGGSLQMFDGNTLVEHNFHIFPDNHVMPAGYSGSATIPAGSYGVLAVYKWTDNQGQVHRSAPSIAQTVVVPGGGASSIYLPIKTLIPTNKTNVKIEMYSTEANGTIYYKTAEIDNNSSISSTDVIRYELDSTLIDNEILYTTGGVLDNIAAPACKLITSHKNRIVIAGLENKNQIQYSKLINEGLPVEFNDTLTINITEDGDKVSAVTSMDDKLIVFKEDSIHVIYGDGPNDLGLQDTFSEPQLITSDVGCIDSNSVVLTPVGTMFKSKKGIYLLSRSLDVQYIGSPVEGFNSDVITSSTLLADENEIRFTTNNDSCLVYNYFFKRWSVFTNYSAVDSLIYNNNFTFLTSNGIVNSQSDDFSDNGRHVKMSLTTAWMSVAGVQGFQRIYNLLILGEYKSSHKLLIKVGYNFNPVFTQDVVTDMQALVESPSYDDTSPYGEDTYYGGNYTPYQLKVFMTIQKCQSIRFLIEDVQTEDFGEGMSLSSLNLQVGVKKSQTTSVSGS